MRVVKWKGLISTVWYSLFFSFNLPLDTSNYVCHLVTHGMSWISFIFEPSFVCHLSFLIYHPFATFFSTVHLVPWLLNLICIFFLMRVSDSALVYEEGRRHYNLRNNRFACMLGMPQLPYIATANSTPHRLSVDNNKEVDPAEQESERDVRTEDVLVKYPAPHPKVLARSFRWHCCCNSI